MMRHSSKLPFLVGLLLLAVGCRNSGSSDKEIVVATASNMQFAIPELSTAFTAETGIPCEFVLGSSGKLMAQIKEGAPFDVFLSADMKYPELLHQQGLGQKSPEVFAYGTLVLWHATVTAPSLETLTLPEVEHIAMANPQTAPYGQAALEVIQKQGFYTTLEDKLVFGESIAQTNQFVFSGAVQAAFTSLSFAMSNPKFQQGYWQALDEKEHSPLGQGVLVLGKSPEKKDSAKRFRNFLFSTKGQQILMDHGYKSP
ncbi:MAG: molybdate ABC transporter substrate-binding protein [Bacteroidota bacterium]